MEIDITGIPKAKVLAALFNASFQQGLGAMDPTGRSGMTTEDAEAAIEESPGMYFDYLKGRVLKVRLDGDGFSPALFDRDNGEGAAERAIKAIAA